MPSGSSSYMSTSPIELSSTIAHEEALALTK